MKRGLAAAILLTLVVAGCGGSAKSHKPSGPPFPHAAAQAAANVALLTLSDLPAGWTSDKSGSATGSTGSTDSTDKEFDQKLATCLHAPAGLLGVGGSESADADSANFNSADQATTVSESVTVGRTNHVQQLFSVLKQPNAIKCVSTTADAYIRQQLAKSSDSALGQVTIGKIQVVPLSVGHYGDDSVAMRTTLPVQGKGLTVDVYLDLIFVRHANGAAVLSVVGEGTPVDARATASYARLAADKLTRTPLPAA